MERFGLLSWNDSESCHGTNRSLPALSDIDQQLQEAYLHDARMGVDSPSPVVLAATDAASRGQLQGNVEALGDLAEIDIADAVGNGCDISLIGNEMSN